MNEYTWIGTGIVALLGPLLGYIIAARKTSGRIKTSDASELWEEASAIRRECAERVKTLESYNHQLEIRNHELIIENARLSRINFGDGHA